MRPDRSENPRSEGSGSRDVARSASVVGLAVLSSRLLGLVREQVFAAFFGAGMVFDAFVTAFRIPNLFRDLFAEGALSAAFVKTFSQELDRKGEARAWQLASRVFTALALIVTLIVLFGIMAAPAFVTVLAPGFDDEKRSLTITLARVMFPFLLMVALAAVSMGILNSRDKFGVPAMASTFFNLGSIVVGLLSAWLYEPAYVEGVVRALADGGELPRDLEPASRAIFGMAVGTIAGGALQFLVQTPALRSTGFRFTPGIDWKDPGLRNVFRLMVPALLGTAATQVNVFVNNNFASRLDDGAVSWLNYGFRLMQFPIGVFGVAIATATLPAVARAAARADRSEFRATLASSVRLALFLTVPSAAGLIVLGEPIVALIYERGSFLSSDTVETAGALGFYAVGLVGYAVVKILAPAFYAIDDAKTPARISVLSIVTNIALCALLVGPLGHRGLALSTALVATGNAVLLAILLRRRVGSLHGRAVAIATAKIAIATGALLVVCRWVAPLLAARFAEPSTADRAVVVGGVILVGAFVYGLVCALLRVEELGRLGAIFKRRR